jgi:Isochorismatase family
MRSDLFSLPAWAARRRGGRPALGAGRPQDGDADAARAEGQERHAASLLPHSGASRPRGRSGLTLHAYMLRHSTSYNDTLMMLRLNMAEPHLHLGELFELMPRHSTSRRWKKGPQQRGIRRRPANCESTARSGFFRDYQVAFPSDCNASFDDGMHQASLKTIDMFFGRVMTSEELLDEMRNELGRNDRVAAE